MANQSGILIIDTITPFLESVEVVKAVEDALDDFADQVESYAKKNAPWQDITGDARAGLFTDVFTEGTDVILALAHSVDYGVWLETIQNGEYAIIMPTLEAFAGEIFHKTNATPTGEELHL